MEETVFHISDLKKYNRCSRLFLLDRVNEKPVYRSFVRLDEQITDLAAENLNVKGKIFSGEREDDPAKAMEALNECDWLIKARFEYGGLRIKVPFLHRNGSGWDLYFLFAGLYPHDNDMLFYCSTVWVLKNLGLQLKEIRMIHLNASYVRGKELDVHALFTLTDHFYNGKNNPGAEIREAVEKHMKDYAPMIRDMRNLMEKRNVPEAVRSAKCAGRIRCRFYEQCFPHEVSAPCNSILNLIGAKERYAMDKEGMHFLKDTDGERIEGSGQQYAQILADRMGGTFADKNALKNWLSHITFPVSFLDFEWERWAVPPYEGMKPYDVLPFEYSLHILKEDGTLTHQVFLSVHDDRKEMAESLIENIPERGSVIAYNADGAEKIRIREMAEYLPQYAEKLLHINDRMIDLQMPFTAGIVYDTRMEGEWTLKKIMSIMNEPGYRDLDINQGMEAVFQWRHLDRNDENVDRKQIEEDLRKYCGMDSYAMTVVYQWLLKLAG